MQEPPDALMKRNAGCELHLRRIGMLPRLSIRPRQHLVRLLVPDHSSVDAHATSQLEALIFPPKSSATIGKDLAMQVLRNPRLNDTNPRTGTIEAGYRPARFL